MAVEAKAVKPLGLVISQLSIHTCLLAQLAVHKRAHPDATNRESCFNTTITCVRASNLQYLATLYLPGLDLQTVLSKLNCSEQCCVHALAGLPKPGGPLKYDGYSLKLGKRQPASSAGHCPCYSKSQTHRKAGETYPFD